MPRAVTKQVCDKCGLELGQWNLRPSILDFCPHCFEEFIAAHVPRLRVVRGTEYMEPTGDGLGARVWTEWEKDDAISPVEGVESER